MPGMVLSLASVAGGATNTPVWQVVLSAAISAAVVSGIVSWILWFAERRERRQEKRRDHLRDFAEQFLSAEEERWLRDAILKSTSDELRAAHEDHRDDDIARLRKEFAEKWVVRLGSTNRARSVVGRMRLYSKTVPLLAQAVLEVEHRSVLEDDNGEVASGDEARYDKALAAFVDGVRDELGISRL